MTGQWNDTAGVFGSYGVAEVPVQKPALFSLSEFGAARLAVLAAILLAIDNQMVIKTQAIIEVISNRSSTEFGPEVPRPGTEIISRRSGGTVQQKLKPFQAGRATNCAESSLKSQRDGFCIELPEFAYFWSEHGAVEAHDASGRLARLM